MNIAPSCKIVAFDQQESQPDLFEVYFYTAAMFQIYLSLLYRVCRFLGSMGFLRISVVDFPSESSGKAIVYFAV